VHHPPDGGSAVNSFGEGPLLDPSSDASMPHPRKGRAALTRPKRFVPSCCCRRREVFGLRSLGFTDSLPIYGNLFADVNFIFSRESHVPCSRTRDSRIGFLGIPQVLRGSGGHSSRCIASTGGTSDLGESQARPMLAFQGAEGARLLSAPAFPIDLGEDCP